MNEIKENYKLPSINGVNTIAQIIGGKVYLVSDGLERKILLSRYKDDKIHTVAISQKSHSVSQITIVSEKDVETLEFMSEKQTDLIYLIDVLISNCKIQRIHVGKIGIDKGIYDSIKEVLKQKKIKWTNKGKLKFTSI